MARSINSRLGYFQAGAVVQPGVLEQFTNQQMLKKAFSICGLVGIDIHNLMLKDMLDDADNV